MTQSLFCRGAWVQIKRQLEVMGLSTHGGKEKLVLRHSMYMREVDAARDQALLDAKHVKPKSQVIREVRRKLEQSGQVGQSAASTFADTHDSLFPGWQINVFEKKRDEEATRSSKRLKPSSSGSLGGSGSSRLPVARERMFDELTTQLQRRMKEQKAAKAQQSKAPQGEAAQGGGQAAGPSMASRGEGARAREGGDPFHFNEEQASAIEARYGSMNGKLPEARSSGTLQDEEEEEIVYMNGDLPTHDLAEVSIHALLSEYLHSSLLDYPGHFGRLPSCVMLLGLSRHLYASCVVLSGPEWVSRLGVQSTPGRSGPDDIPSHLPTPD